MDVMMLLECSLLSSLIVLHKGRASQKFGGACWAGRGKREAGNKNYAMANQKAKRNRLMRWQ